MKEFVGNMEQFEEICTEYEEICGKYKKYVDSPSYIGSGTSENSDLFLKNFQLFLLYGLHDLEKFQAPPPCIGFGIEERVVLLAISLYI